MRDTDRYRSGAAIRSTFPSGSATCISRARHGLFSDAP
jgi:hypothetical protein